MALPTAFLDELRARLPVSDVVGRRVRLARAGREFRGLCPFHKEKTPSFWVNDQKGFFHCFGCGAHGDIVGFTMRFDNLSFPEAVERLAAEAGLEVPRPSPEERRRFEHEKTLHAVVEMAAKYFEAQLLSPSGRAALQYLRGRGLDDETIHRFRLGYAPSDGQSLPAALLKEGATEAQLVEVGLVRRPEDGRAPYAFFRDRVMFPVADRRGRVVAFGGRILSGDGPKYVNSPDNPLFHKGSLLYGLSRARAAAGDGEPLVTVEGYMDVIALVAAGFRGAVAPLGTAMTETQIATLWKIAPPGNRTPVLCFDGDAAGQRAALRAIDRVLPHLAPDQSVRIAFMPPGEDPDSLIRRSGAAAMREVLDTAKPLVDVLWQTALDGRNLSTPEARAGLQAHLDEQAGRIADRAVQDYYRREFRERLEALFPRRPTGRGGAKPGGRPTTAFGAPRRRRLPPRADDVRPRLLLGLVLAHPSLFDACEEDLGRLELPPDLDKLRQQIINDLSGNPALDAEELRRHLKLRGFSKDVEDLETLVRTHGPGMHGSKGKAEDESDPVLRFWRTTYRILQREQVSAELREAEIAQVRNPTPQREAKIKELRRQLLELEAGVLTDADSVDFAESDM